VAKAATESDRSGPQAGDRCEIPDEVSRLCHPRVIGRLFHGPSKSYLRPAKEFARTVKPVAGITANAPRARRPV